MDWPEVTVLLCTYERKDELAATLDALVTNLSYPALKWIVCDDSSPSNFAGKLTRTKPYRDLGIQIIRTAENGGWAKNVNNGLAHVTTDYTFFIEDDYVLCQPLDLKIGMALMLTQPHVGMLRYRGTAGDHVVLHQLDANVSSVLPDHQDGVGLPGHLTFCLLDGNSPTLYIYSHGAHLKRRAFHEFYGLYPEGLKLGATEERYAHIVKDKMKEPGALPIGILPAWIPNWFDHIGTSYQHTEADRGEVVASE
jgi:glycosyltransferase involved in cell wall biosynthesis